MSTVIVISCVILFGVIVILLTVKETKQQQHILKMQKVGDTLQDDAWETRLEATNTLKKEVTTLGKPQRVQNRSALVAGDYQPTEDLSRKAALTNAITLLLTASTDPDWHVRSEAVTAFGHTHDIRAVLPLLGALRDEHRTVRQHAAEALNDISPVVHTIVFGGQDLQVSDPDHTLWNPDLSGLTLPLPRLQDMTIVVATCDRSRLEACLTYLEHYPDKTYLKDYVSLSLSGDIGQFPLSLYNPCIHCGRIEVSIESIVFGTEAGHDSDPLTTLHNPDVSAFLLPLTHVKQVRLDTATYDVHQVERFLTYAVNCMGQRYLKTHVDVHIYGDVRKLHSNVRNTLMNLCRRERVHEKPECVAPPNGSNKTGNMV